MAVTWRSHDIHMFSHSMKEGMQLVKCGSGLALVSTDYCFMFLSSFLLAARTVFVGGIGDAAEDDLYEFFSSNNAEPSDVRIIGSKGLVECLWCSTTCS